MRYKGIILAAILIVSTVIYGSNEPTLSATEMQIILTEMEANMTNLQGELSEAKQLLDELETYDSINSMQREKSMYDMTEKALGTVVKSSWALVAIAGIVAVILGIAMPVIHFLESRKVEQIERNVKELKERETALSKSMTSNKEILDELIKEAKELGKESRNALIHAYFAIAMNNNIGPYGKIEYYEKIIVLDPESDGAIENLAEVYSELGNHAKAKTLIEKALSINSDPQHYLAAARISLNADKRKEAEKCIANGYWRSKEKEIFLGKVQHDEKLKVFSKLVDMLRECKTFGDTRQIAEYLEMECANE